jgi:hypothetical protein
MTNNNATRENLFIDIYQTAYKTCREAQVPFRFADARRGCQQLSSAH